MKNFFIILFTILFGALVGFTNININAMGGAGLTFDAAEKSVKNNEVFDVKINLQSGGENLDTVRLALSFSPDYMEVVNVRLGEIFPNISPLSSFDNNKGVIFYGGFRTSGGTNQDGTAAIITFKPKKEGVTDVNITSETKLISAGEEKYNGQNQKITVNIAAGEAKPSTTIIYADTATEKFVPVIEVKSDTHPNQTDWYKVSNVAINAFISAPKSISVLYYDFDQAPDTDPLQKQDTSNTEFTFENLTDGIWYFHLKAKLDDASFTNAIHYIVKIDSTSPNKMQAYLEAYEIEEGQNAVVKFATMDQTSGVAYYEVTVDGKNSGRQESPYAISGLSAGDHDITVTAYDLAGNSIDANSFVRVREKAGEPITPIAQAAQEIKGISGKMIVGLVIAAFLIIFIIIQVKRK